MKSIATHILMMTVVATSLATLAHADIITGTADGAAAHAKAFDGHSSPSHKRI